MRLVAKKNTAVTVCSNCSLSVNCKGERLGWKFNRFPRQANKNAPKLKSHCALGTMLCLKSSHKPAPKKKCFNKERFLFTRKSNCSSEEV